MSSGLTKRKKRKSDATQNATRRKDEGTANMIEELERYAKESKVDELFRDLMTGCFKQRPSAPVKYILEYLASEYPEESLEHARAFVDLKSGILDATIKTTTTTIETTTMRDPIKVEEAVEEVEIEKPIDVADDAPAQALVASTKETEDAREDDQTCLAPAMATESESPNVVDSPSQDASSNLETEEVVEEASVETAPSAETLTE